MLKMVIKNYKIEFSNIYAYWEFEKGFDLKKHYNDVPVVVGGFEDGHIEVTYSLPIWKLNNLVANVKKFNKYSKFYGLDYAAKLVG